MKTIRTHAETVETGSTCVVCDNAEKLTLAEDFSRTHQLPLLAEKNRQYAFQLCYFEDRVELYSRQLNTGIHVDFCAGKLAHRRQFGGGRGQAIAKAVGLKQGRSPKLLDATAGLASDAFTLATLGCAVTMLERSSILCSLIEDAIRRAANQPALDDIFQRGFQLRNVDAIDYMQQMSSGDYPDVIYLDPMYPEKKKSAQVKKSMQILQLMHGADDNAGELLECSLSHVIKRVVVKRPIHAGAVNDRKPSTCIKSKNTRYDIYSIEKL